MTREHRSLIRQLRGRCKPEPTPGLREKPLMPMPFGPCDSGARRSLTNRTARELAMKEASSPIRYLLEPDGDRRPPAWADYQTWHEHRSGEFRTIGACSGALVPLRSDFVFERRRGCGWESHKTNGQNGRSGEI